MKTEQDPSTATTWLLLAGIAGACALMGAVMCLARSATGPALLVGSVSLFLFAVRGRPKA